MIVAHDGLRRHSYSLRSSFRYKEVLGGLSRGEVKVDRWQLIAPIETMPTNKYGVSEELTSYEIFWRDTYHFLCERGYKLRPRYHPDWVPSWKPGRELDAEDWQCIHVRPR